MGPRDVSILTHPSVTLSLTVPLDDLLDFLFPLPLFFSPAEMRVPRQSLSWWAIGLVVGCSGQVDPQLTGTWSTKSNKVFTGPVRRPDRALRDQMLNVSIR